MHFQKGLGGYLLLRVGPFPDVYELLAAEHLSKGNPQSALVAGEKARSVFAEWGHTHAAHASLLGAIAGYELEARDAVTEGG